MLNEKFLALHWLKALQKTLALLPFRKHSAYQRMKARTMIWLQQMRQLMLALGCVDAFNVDGGASCGMYYNGTYLSKPGRELTVTLQVFVSP